MRFEDVACEGIAKLNTQFVRVLKKLQLTLKNDLYEVILCDKKRAEGK